MRPNAAGAALWNVGDAHAGASGIRWIADDATAILFMPIAIFDSATIPRDRRAELEADVVAGANT